jgi:hypothetical protein
MMAKNGNDDDRDDNFIDSLLARLVMKVINETKALYLVRAQDLLILEGMCSYFEKHETIDSKARRLAIRTLKGVTEGAKLIDDDELDNLVNAIDFWNSHVHDTIASKEHWLGKCY